MWRHRRILTPVYVGGEVEKVLATPPIEFDTPRPWSEGATHEDDQGWWFEPLPCISNDRSLPVGVTALTRLTGLPDLSHLTLLPWRGF